MLVFVVAVQFARSKSPGSFELEAELGDFEGCKGTTSRMPLPPCT